MAVARLPTLRTRLKALGYPAELPAAAVERASIRGRQRLFLGTIESLPDIAAEHGLSAPATLVFGETVRVLHGDATGVFENDQLDADA